MTEESQSRPDCGWVKMFHPAGVLVTLPVPAGDYRSAFAAVNAALEAGFLAREVGLEAGEEKEDIGWVLRLDHEKDGEITPTVLLYSNNPGLTWSFLRRYMNTPDDVAAFEAASGLKYDQLPAYPGNDHPERGAGQKTDRFIVKAPKPFGMIWKPNPRYMEAPAGQDTRSLAQKRKRDFVRWAQQAQPAPRQQAEPAQQAGQPPAEQPASNPGVEKIWADWLATKPDAAALNGPGAEEYNRLSPEDRRIAWRLMSEYAKAQMMSFNATTKKWESAF